LIFQVLAGIDAFGIFAFLVWIVAARRQAAHSDDVVL
jgi:hypothetical protein